jgi:uncharacterized membrane protein
MAVPTPIEPVLAAASPERVDTGSTQSAVPEWLNLKMAGYIIMAIIAIYVFTSVKAFADRFCSRQRVFWRVKTCNRSYP